MNEGVHFVRGRAAEVTRRAPAPEEEGQLIVKVEDTLLGIVRRIPVDMVILSSGLAPAKDAKAGRADRSASAARPTASSSSGIPSSSRSAPSPTASSSPAAARAPRTSPTRSPRRAPRRRAPWRWSTTPRSRSSPPSPTSTPRSAAAVTSASGLCPHDAIQYNEEKKVAEVINAACKGCGVCVAACGSNVPQQRGYLDDQIFAEIEGAMAL